MTIAIGTRSGAEPDAEAARAVPITRRRPIRAITVTAGGVLVAVEVILLRHGFVAALHVLGNARPLWVLTAVAATLVTIGRRYAGQHDVRHLSPLFQ